MDRCLKILLGLVTISASFFFSPSAQADSSHFWQVVSPDHEQTWADGMEQNRVWAERGRDRHLVVLMEFTNDPFVDRQNPREYDNFSFAFPGVTLGKDGRTFYYRTPEGRSIPIAAKRADFFGINEIHLLPNASLIVHRPHGYLTLALAIDDLPPAN